MAYVELHARSAFSFLRGASSPEQLARQCAEAGLAAMAPLADDKRMLGYQPYWAADGELLARAGQRPDAAEAFRVAIGLTTDEAVRSYLQGQLTALQDG